MIDLKYLNYTPEYELDLQGWNSYSPVFEELIIKWKPSIIIEVGTWKGASAINMADICKKNNLNSKIYCIDTWLGCFALVNHGQNLMSKHGYPQLYYQFLSNVFHKKNQDIIIPIPNTSAIGYQILKNANIKANLIYIDGSHEYKDVTEDITNYYELLDNNGIIFGDDFDDYRLGVVNGVTDFCKNKNISFEVKDRKWIIKK